MISVDHIHNLDRRITNEGAAFESAAGSNELSMQLWVPSERVGIHLIDVPTAPERKWPELIPWLLEDRILQPVEQMHFVIGERDDQGQVQVFALSCSDMQEWQRVADNAGVAALSMVPDFLVLPWEEGRISVGWREGQCLVRSGSDRGFAASPELAWSMIDGLLEAAEISPRLSISIPDASLMPEHLRQQADINQSAIDWQFADIPTSPNLLTGQFKPVVRSLPSAAWLPAAGLAALALLLVFSYFQIANGAMQQQVEVLEKRLIADYSRLFGSGNPRAVDVRSAAERQLAAGFKQQQAVQTGTVVSLSALNSLMASCDCDLVSLVADKEAIELTLNNGAKIKTKPLNIPGYQLSITQQPKTSEDSIVLMMSPSNGGRR